MHNAISLKQKNKLEGALVINWLSVDFYQLSIDSLLTLHWLSTDSPLTLYWLPTDFFWLTKMIISHDTCATCWNFNWFSDKMTPREDSAFKKLGGRQKKKESFFGQTDWMDYLGSDRNHNLRSNVSLNIMNHRPNRRERGWTHSI